MKQYSFADLVAMQGALSPELSRAESDHHQLKCAGSCANPATLAIALTELTSLKEKTDRVKKEIERRLEAL